MDDETALAGALLGCAVGDALGLPAEGLRPDAVARRFEPLDRYCLLGRTGIVSDDTEQSALVVQSLIRARTADASSVTRTFRRALVGWLWRLPFGIGLATLRAGLKATVGLHRGVDSAGNGAMMRSPVIGVALRDHALRRREVAAALARVTHTHPEAVDASVFVAEVAAELASGSTPEVAVEEARRLLETGPLRTGLDEARMLATTGVDPAEAGERLGTSGWVRHSLPLVVYCLLRFADAPFEAVRAAVRAGGDTDTHAAMAGALVGGWKGPGVLPAELVERVASGPFGERHLRALATAWARGDTRAPRYAWPLALLRNLALYPVVLAHGVRRLLP